MKKEQTTKIEVVQVNGQKLDPNAQYLFIWNDIMLDHEKISHVAVRLAEEGLNIIHTGCPNPENALKVYQIPKSAKQEEIDNER